MKRLSLLAVALTLLMTASGCCCGLFHGGCGGCGYPPPACGSCGSCGYAPAPCSSCGGGYAPAYGPAPCPTCPNGGCGVQGPVMQQGAFYEGTFGGTAVSQATPAAPTTVAANDLHTY